MNLKENEERALKRLRYKLALPKSGWWA